MGVHGRRSTAATLVLVLAMSAGCAVQRGGLATDDGGDDADGGGGMDTGPIGEDAAPEAGADDARIDAPVGDAGIDAGIDAGPDDAGPDDAGPDDAGSDDAGTDAGPPSCTELYGDLDEFHLCEERADECEIYVQLSDTSCDDACSDGGGTCIDAFAEESDSARCSRARDDTCSSTHNDEICICSRP